MKILKNTISRIIALLPTAGLVLTLSGCLQDNPMETELQKAQISGNVVQSDIGPIHILASDSKLQSLLKEASRDTLLHVERLIKAKEGGEIKSSDDLLGHIQIKFKRDDLLEDTNIKLQWLGTESGDSRLYSLECLPHGTEFNNPVKIEVSYRGADLTGVNESKLRIFYSNPTTGLWEFIGGEVDTENKIVTAYLNHFSRYAVAWSN